MINYVVIGAGFGDESKGLMTDYLARKHDAVVNVRFNGGAQAGHTVIDADKRHVFSHVGAATFTGASTFLSSKFITNPFVLSQELKDLSRYSRKPVIEIHPDSQVTTAFDMIINGAKELAREQRHGSCGLGINETVTRALKGYTLSVEDLTSYFSVFSDKMQTTYSEYFEPQLAKLRELNNPAINDLLNISNLEQEIDNLSRASNLFEVRRKPSIKGNVIFEGAQGLGLDEFLGKFPHVTRSVTGLPSAVLAASEIGVNDITPVYVTRCYKTRHGAGPLLHEGVKITSKDLIDNTNVTGRWQGELRFAPLDVVVLHDLINKDFARSKSMAQVLRVKVNPPQIAVTCLDQVDDLIYFNGGKKSGVKYLISDLNEICQVKYLSYGPTAKDVVEK